MVFPEMSLLMQYVWCSQESTVFLCCENVAICSRIYSEIWISEVLWILLISWVAVGFTNIVISLYVLFIPFFLPPLVTLRLMHFQLLCYASVTVKIFQYFCTCNQLLTVVSNILKVWINPPLPLKQICFSSFFRRQRAMRFFQMPASCGFTTFL